MVNKGKGLFPKFHLPSHKPKKGSGLEVQRKFFYQSSVGSAYPSCYFLPASTVTNETCIDPVPAEKVAAPMDHRLSSPEDYIQDIDQLCRAGRLREARQCLDEAKRHLSPPSLKRVLGEAFDRHPELQKPTASGGFAGHRLGTSVQEDRFQTGGMGYTTQDRRTMEIPPGQEPPPRRPLPYNRPPNATQEFQKSLRPGGRDSAWKTSFNSSVPQKTADSLPQNSSASTFQQPQTKKFWGKSQAQLSSHPLDSESLASGPKKQAIRSFDQDSAPTALENIGAYSVSTLSLVIAMIGSITPRMTILALGYGATAGLLIYSSYVGLFQLGLNPYEIPSAQAAVVGLNQTSSTSTDKAIQGEGSSPPRGTQRTIQANIGVSNQTLGGVSSSSAASTQSSPAVEPPLIEVVPPLAETTAATGTTRSERSTVSRQTAPAAAPSRTTARPKATTPPPATQTPSLGESPQNSLQEVAIRAQRHIREGKFQDAIDLLQAEIPRTPRISQSGLRAILAFAHNEYGTKLVQQGKLSEAVAQYRKAVTEAGTESNYHMNLGNAIYYQATLGTQPSQRRNQLLAQARKALEEAIKHNPSNYLAFHRLALVQETLNQREAARQAWRQVARLAPADSSHAKGAQEAFARLSQRN